MTAAKKPAKSALGSRLKEGKGKNASFYWVYMTAASREEALKLARILVEERLAACTNVLSPMQSFYWWKGALEEGHEAVLIAKTRRSRLEALTRRVKSLHSYECPCILHLPIMGGNPGYLAWLESETTIIPRP